MSVPASLATPAATAAIVAYLSARWRLPVDFSLSSCAARSTYRFRQRERADRLNSFYLLEEHALNKSTANELFLIYEGKSWTFRRFYDVVLRYAGWLHDTHAVAPGEIVAIDFMNSPQFLFLLVAVWSLGATPAFINYNLAGASLVHSIRASAARLLIVDPEIESQVLAPEVLSIITASNFRNNAFPITISVLDANLQSSLNYFPPHRAPDSTRNGALGRSPCVLISTSGTTGLPKAAIVPWERTAIASGFCARWQGLRSVTHKHPDRFYTSMPLYHSSAFQLGFHMCLINATTFVLGHKFSVSGFWSEARAGDATVIQYVGETLRYLLAAPVQPGDRTSHKVRMAFGNGLRPDVWKKFKSRFNIETIAEFYGATEGVAASWNFNRNDFSDGAIGQNGRLGDLILGQSQTIVQVDWETEKPWRHPHTGFCQPMPRGEPGELLFLVDSADIEAKFQGYFGNKEATNSKILRDVLKKGDAYFRSGDVVRWDKEGRLWFSDRIGDTFRWKSENVSTAEVAEVIGYHPAVVEANVYGVRVPGHEGRAGCAALLLKESALQDGKGGVVAQQDVLESLATYATNSLPHFAVPVFIRVLHEVKTTGNNKPQKHLLRDQGVDLEAVRRAGDRDEIYWLKPGSTKYTVYQVGDWQRLARNEVKL